MSIIADEFASFLDSAKKSPLEEKVNSFGEIVEKIMAIVLRIPDLVDETLAGLNQQISSLEGRVNAMNSDLAGIKARGVAAPAGGAPRLALWRLVGEHRPAAAGAGSKRDRHRGDDRPPAASR